MPLPERTIFYEGISLRKNLSENIARFSTQKIDPATTKWFGQNEIWQNIPDRGLRFCFLFGIRIGTALRIWTPFLITSSPVHSEFQICVSKPHAVGSVSTLEPPIYSIRLLHSRIDLVAVPN